MTRKQIDMLVSAKIGIEAALYQAFEAGEARMMGSHEHFKQTHEPAIVVVPALMARIDTSIEYIKREGRRG